MSCSVSALLDAALEKNAIHKDFPGKNSTNPVQPGTHGMWSGPLGEVVLAVLLDSTHLQKYKERRYGYIPDGLPEDANEWTLTEPLKNEQFSYVEKGNTIFLTLH